MPSQFDEIVYQLGFSPYIGRVQYDDGSGIVGIVSIGDSCTVIVAEAEDDQTLTGENKESLENQIRQQVNRGSDIALRYVKVVEHGWLLKTSSGKVARAANKEKYLRQAGEWAAQQFDNLHALAFFDRALELTALDRAEERYAILAGRELVNDSLGKLRPAFAKDGTISERLQRIVIERSPHPAELCIDLSLGRQLNCHWPTGLHLSSLMIGILSFSEASWAFIRLVTSS